MAANPGQIPHGDYLPEDRFLDREESWLRFNQRVLELAEDTELPLLERVRFLSIFATNLDEFFMVRVAGLMRRMATGLAVRSASGRQPREVLERTAVVAHELMLRHAACFHTDILPALAKQDIEILRWDDLADTERENLSRMFRERIYPVLTPLVVDSAHPFPYISGLSLNLAVVVRDPETEARLFARVKVPELLPRLLEASPDRFTPLEDVIAAHLTQLFNGMEIVERHAFRVTRNQDLEVDEDITEDLLQALEKELLRRRFGPPVRLEVEQSISEEVLELLMEELGVSDRQVYRVPGPLDLGGLAIIADLDRSELKYPPFVPSKAALPSEGSIFAALRERDVVVHHPYDSFTTSVQRLIEEAADDPRVLAIKQTLYRTSGDSPVVDALISAADAGKQVVVVVEIKARFDESANIEWARKLEQAGCHVVYGFVGLKTHCKLALVVRQEPDGSLRRYCHIGTGNYHPKTARLYEDLGLLTAAPEVAEDVTELFNHLTGYSRKVSYRQLLVAPNTLRSGLVLRIEREIGHHRAGRPARVRFKCNSLVDEVVIDALYRASQAGVPVDVWVRGICALRPGVAGMSDNIRVRSVLGRFLEHSRIYAFECGGSPEVWFGSADLMHRNLDRRVEAMVRVNDVGHRDELIRFLDRGMDDDTASWHLHGDGDWTRYKGTPDNPATDIQSHLMRTRRWRTVDGG
ncbi:RNA degradosome polyphosphate kinase [Actinocorallia sp. A-T 12471]|uniref:RNA degradosome polyphosphate kinase n=1 Tax=Actinocorallia sp. A-T 12471 TaxID=3089813 RepID=UPI0029D3F3B1|nr:RNA degradosome polyphosphate kinase [Actinocorallia sp. A-T 12471]MDX6745073.1 RNA degradosome polyphosphate kinase [Actinocorallia sp. A-T 12471]